MITVREVSWALTGVSPRAIVGRHSKRHLVIDGRALALCGTRIPWLRVHGSFEGDCARCFAVLASRREELERQ